jgi:alcohol dehydrogenase, propanol-preferring
MVMRAAQIHEDLTLVVDSVDTPSPGRGEVLVHIHAAGVCGTDLHILDGMIKPDPYPMTVGHEAAGVVESTGDGVRMTVGTRVAVYNKLFCGACAQCLVGRHNLCDREPGQLGFNRDGGDADYVVVPERNLAAVPDGVDLATAAVLTCAGMTAVHATKLSGLRIGDTAVVNGIGGVGILVVQAARRAGARVIAVADTREKMALAQAHGAAGGVVLTGADGYESVPEQVRGLSDGRGADVFFELVGTTASMTAGVRTLAKGGRFVSTGYTDQVLTIHPIEFILSETSLVSTVAATLPDLEDALRLAAEGAMVVPIAGRYPLEGITDALTALRHRAVLGRQILELVGGG